MRPSALSTISKVPGISLSIERVPIRPVTQGICTAKWVVRSLMLGTPNTAKEAGAGSVSHIDSMAASFIFWLPIVAPCALYLVG